MNFTFNEDSLDPTARPEALAEEAISYLLVRVLRDPDLRYHMLHTEALHRLCVAHASFKRLPWQEVKDAVELQDDTRGAKTRIERLDQRIEDLEQQLRDLLEGGAS